MCYPAFYEKVTAEKEDLENRLRSCALLVSQQEISEHPCRINTRLTPKFGSKSPLARKKLPQDKWAWEKMQNSQASPIEVAENSQSGETDFSSSPQLTQSWTRRSPLLPTPINPPLPTSPSEASPLCLTTQSWTIKETTTSSALSGAFVVDCSEDQLASSSVSNGAQSASMSGPAERSFFSGQANRTPDTATFPNTGSTEVPLVYWPVLNSPEQVVAAVKNRPNSQAADPVEIRTEGCVKEYISEWISTPDINEMPMPSASTDSAETVLPGLSKERLAVTASQAQLNVDATKRKLEDKTSGHVPSEPRVKIRLKIASTSLISKGKNSASRQMQQPKSSQQVKPHLKRKRSSSRGRSRRSSHNSSDSRRRRSKSPGPELESKKVRSEDRWWSPSWPNRRSVLLQQNEQSPVKPRKHRPSPDRVSNHKRPFNSRSPRRIVRRRSVSRSPRRNVRHHADSRSPRRNVRRRSDSPIRNVPPLRFDARLPLRSFERRSNSGSSICSGQYRHPSIIRSVRRRSHSRSLFRHAGRRSDSWSSFRDAHSPYDDPCLFRDHRRPIRSPFQQISRYCRSRSPVHLSSRSPVNSDGQSFDSGSALRTDRHTCMSGYGRHRANSRPRDLGSPNHFYDIPDSPINYRYESGYRLRRSSGQLDLRSPPEVRQLQYRSDDFKQHSHSSTKLEYKSHRRQNDRGGFIHQRDQLTSSGSRSQDHKRRYVDHGSHESVVNQYLSERPSYEYQQYLPETEEASSKKSRSRSRSWDNECEFYQPDIPLLSIKLNSGRYDYASRESRSRERRSTHKWDTNSSSSNHRAAGYADKSPKARRTPSGSLLFAGKERHRSRNDEPYYRQPKLEPKDQVFDALEHVQSLAKRSPDNLRKSRRLPHGSLVISVKERPRSRDDQYFREIKPEPQYAEFEASENLQSSANPLPEEFPDQFQGPKSGHRSDGSLLNSDKERSQSRNDERYCQPKQEPRDEAFEALEKFPSSAKSSAGYDLIPIDSSESESESEYDPTSEAIVGEENESRKRCLSIESPSAKSAGLVVAKRSRLEESSTNLVGARVREISPVHPPKIAASRQSFPIGWSGHSVDLDENRGYGSVEANLKDQYQKSSRKANLRVKLELAKAGPPRKMKFVENRNSRIRSQNPTRVNASRCETEANARPSKEELQLLQLLQLLD